jgi:hypothetical protein
MKEYDSNAGDPPLRHRILIAAAVATVVGRAEIRDIRLAAWTRRRIAGVRSAPVVQHLNPAVVIAIDEEEETLCDS